jgi:hypothetical protein
VTGPLAPLFAQLEQAVEDAFRIELDECCTGPKYEASLKQQRDERLAALSVIKRHVQNMADPSEFIRNQELAAERAMRRSSGEGYAYEQGRRDAFFEVRDHMERRARAALPASGAQTAANAGRNRVAREKGA